MSEVVAESTIEVRPPWRHRVRKIVLWVVAAVLFWVVLDLLGVDVRGWIESFWDSLKQVPAGYVIAALVFQTRQAFFAGLCYVWVLQVAYPGAGELWPVIAAYAVGGGMNRFLAGNIGTFGTLFMVVAIIPGFTIGRSIAAYLVQKIFF